MTHKLNILLCGSKGRNTRPLPASLFHHILQTLLSVLLITSVIYFNPDISDVGTEDGFHWLDDAALTSALGLHADPHR